MLSNSKQNREALLWKISEVSYFRLFTFSNYALDDKMGEVDRGLKHFERKHKIMLR